jgi:hypothetical protein
MRALAAELACRKKIDEEHLVLARNTIVKHSKDMNRLG